MSLPNGYTQLEYIQSDGNQHIDTGYYPTVSVRVVTRVELLRGSTENLSLYGAYGDSGQYVFQLIINNNKWQARYGAADAYSAAITTRGLTDIDHNKATATITSPDGTISLTSRSSLSGSITYPLYIFARNFAGSASGRCALKLYYFQVYDGDTLVRDYVPARNSDGVIGLYDLANGVFYTNAGSGEFTTGAPTVPLSDCTLLEYIEATGTQYINTMLCPTSDTRVVTDAEILSDGNVYLYGTHDTGSGYQSRFGVLKRSDKAWQVFIGSSGATNTLEDFVAGRYTIDQNGGTVMYTTGDVTKSFSSSDQIRNTRGYTIYIFARNNTGVLDQLSAYKLYSFKAYEGETLVRDYIPAARRSDGVIGLYDLVEGKFYANQGAGAFIAGPELAGDEPETPALVIGPDIRITEGMTIIGGVLHRIVLS